MPFPTFSLRRMCVACALVASAAVGVPALFAQAPVPTGNLAPGVNPDDMMGELILRDTPLEAVLAQLEQLTGRIVLRPQALPAPQITLNARELTRAEAIFAIETVLSLNGIGLVPADERFLKVVPITSVRTEAPELYVGSLRAQPASGKVVSKLFRLEHIDTATFQQQVGQFLSGFGSIVPFQNSNAVIVTDTVANLQRLEYVVEEVDRRVAVETKFFPINYAKASELAQQIRTMLDSARSSFQGTSGGGARGAVQPGQPNAPGAAPVPAALPGLPGAEGGASLYSVLTSNTSITPDDRTNQIIVIGNPANLPFFENLIAQLDVAADPLTSIEVIPMNYAKADELAGLLSDFISGRSRSTGSGDRTNANQTRTRVPFGTAANADRAGPASATPPRIQAVENAVNNAAAGEGSSQFSELITVNADERTNSIIVAGTNNDINLLRKVIAELDVVLAQVRIDVLIAEVTLTKENPRGIDAFKVAYNQNNGQLVVSDIAMMGLTGAFGGTLQGYSLTGFNYNAAIAATQVNSNINLLSAPNILTTHNQPASIIVGQAVPIISSTIQNTGGVGGITPIQNVNYEEIALTLDVTPIIGPNDVVQMELKQAVNDIVDTVTVNGFPQPIIGRREASSFVSVKSGEMIVIGGLQKNTLTKTKNRIPIIGEIPLIGELFASRKNSRTKQELLIFLRPVVLRDTTAANANARESVEKLKLNKENLELLKEITGVDIEAEKKEEGK